MNSNRNILSKFISGELSATEYLEAAFPPSDDVTQMLVAVAPQEYAASLIAKAVEDCDVQLLGLSVTGMRSADGRPVVLLRIGASNAESVERSLARYGYEVIYKGDADIDTPEHQKAIDRANELLHILEL